MPLPKNQNDQGGWWEVVVARYEEDLTWLLPVADRVHVFNKGSSGGSGGGDSESKFASWTDLPNTGREGDTYLRFMAGIHVDRRPGVEVVVFVQGRIDDHVDGDPLYHVFQIAKQAREQGLSVPRYTIPADYRFRHVTYFGKALHQTAHGGFGHWFEDVVGTSFPAERSPMPFFKNGIFAAKVDRVLARPAAFYDRVRATLQAEDPENGHFLERAWAYILS